MNRKAVNDEVSFSNIHSDPGDGAINNIKVFHNLNSVEIFLVDR